MTVTITVKGAKLPDGFARDRSLFRCCLAASVALVTLATCEAELSAAAETPLAPSAYDWTGLYVGGHFAYGWGTLGPRTNPNLGQGVIFPASVTGLVGGYQAGYNFHLPSNIVLGLEADVSFLSPVNQAATGTHPFSSTLDYFATARGRIGYASGALMPYLTGGAAWGQIKVNSNDADGNAFRFDRSTSLGWIAGAGLEYAIDRYWSAKLEYQYIDLGSRTFVPSNGSVVNVDPKLQIVKLGLNFHVDSSAPGAAGLLPPAPESNNWNIHGQTTFIQQGYPRFRAPYDGPNSLPSRGQDRETWTTTAFLGFRLWEGGELYFNPELAQGTGVGGTLGLGGFSNGEAQKGGAPAPRFRPQRYFFRQTFGLGGEQEAMEDGPNQLATKQDIDRVTLTIGRFAIGDIFDANSYAHDPRADFMNWAIWSSAAYDFPADLPGFTRGAVVELNRKDWAVRAGWFQVPKEPNSDVLVFKTGGAVIEFEERHSIFDQLGKVRIGLFANRGHTGNYRDALAAISANQSTDINDAIVQTRQDRLKYGFYVNAEQAITKDVGAFARLSWNDGQTEILSFTDIDRSISGGLSIKGGSWGRPNDTVGIGGAINGLSSAHRDFLAAGGLGLLIGDGALNYAPEKIAETYYAYEIADGLKLTVDYQFIANPAYNADRGPVHLFAGRVHAEF